jgi:prophage regulatory protein
MDSFTVILPIAEVMRRTGLSRATIYRYIAQHRFPPSVRRGHSSNVGWLQADIEDYIRQSIGLALV